MNDIAREYGTALYMLACEEGSVDDFAKGLQTIAQIFQQEPKYMLFLTSPSIPMQQRIDAIAAAFANILPMHLLSFLQLLCEKGRLPCFEDAKQVYCELYEAAQRILHVHAKSAFPLTEMQKERLKQKLESTYASTVEIDFSEDADLLGGVVLKIDDKVIDGSVRYKMQQIKDVISG